MQEELFESPEAFEHYLRKRRRKKKILAFVLAITILITFAIPFGMMIPEQIQEQKPDELLYAVEKLRILKIL